MRSSYLSILLAIIAPLTFQKAEAQVTNTGILFVTSGTTFSSMGDFTNTATGNYQNNGTAYISGNITNDQPAMSPGSGTTILNGTSAQTIGGTSPFRCFNVTLNNTAGLSLTNRFGIGDGTSGALTFTNGQISSGTNSQDVYFYPGSGYTGFSATNHIIGYVTKSGNTDFTFPIGNGTFMTDLDLSGISATADFQVLYNGTGYGTYNTTLPIIPGGIFQKEWWDIHETAGTSGAMVTLKWNDAREALNHTDPSTLLVAHFTGGSWQSEGGTSSNPASSSTGTVGPSNPVSTFSPFTFGSTTTTLPIVLSSFTAIDKDCQADLSWSTSLEQNAAGFDIQQSINGSAFNDVAYIKANGTPSAYTTTISQTVPLANYRIRLVDLDGNFVFSQIASLQLTCLASGENLSVYPNPVVTGTDMTVKYTVTTARGEAQAQLFDMAGKRVQSTVIQVNAGLNTYNIPAAALAPGTYTLFIIGEGWKTEGVKIVKGN